MVLLERIIPYIRKGIDYLRNLNLFPSITAATESPHRLRDQIVSTRLFIYLFLNALAILLLYTSAVTVNKTFTLSQPTLQQCTQLYQQHPESLVCPCTTSSINYERFFHLNFIVHQVCSSEYIDDRWIDYLLQTQNTKPLATADSRVTGVFLFQALSSLCVLVRETIANSLTRLSSSSYISSDVTPPLLFNSQMQAMSEQFESSTTNEFLSSLRIVRDNFEANYLFSALISNGNFAWNQNSATTSTFAVTYEGCSCMRRATCVSPSRIYRGITGEVLFLIRGMVIGCYPFEELVQSTFECFSDQLRFDEMRSHLSSNSVWNGTALDNQTKTRYSSTSTVGEMLEKLMVEEWNWRSEYSEYFDECRTVECRYTVQTRNDVIIIVTTVLGLIGGLVTALRLTIPRIVWLIRWKKRRQVVEESVDRRCSINATLRKCHEYVRNLNFFPSITAATDPPHRLRDQIISTRLFIVSLLLSLAILLLYSSTATVNKTVTLSQPTLQQYNELYQQHPESLVCPCTSISINHEQFVHLNFTIHQVCSSDFVNDLWLDYLLRMRNTLSAPRPDFRKASFLLFQSLRSLCELVKETIANSLTRLSSSSYISSDVTPPLLFSSQMQAMSEQFESATTNEFLSSLRIVRDTVQANYLLSAPLTNGYLEWLYQYDRMQLFPMSYGGCSCMRSAKCVSPSPIYDGTGVGELFRVRGMLSGCYAMEVLVLSTLECFFDQLCFDQIQSNIGWAEMWNGSVLDNQMKSRFSTRSTVGEMVQKLMLEEWNWRSEYSEYFNECRPVECRYTVKTRNDVIIIVTTLLGRIGGLIAALRLIVPRIVWLIRWKKRRQLVESETSRRSWSSILRKCNEYLCSLNLFPSVTAATDPPHRLRNQIVSSRLFIYLFLHSLAILLLYTSFVTISKTLTLSQPTLQQYTQLHQQHPESLVCPCTSISIKYDRFVHLNFTLHQVCSSDFVTDRWLDYLQQAQTSDAWWLMDFRMIIGVSFQGLRSLCELVKETIANSLTRLSASSYISSDVTPSLLFESSTTNEFLSSLRIVRDIIQANFLLAALQTNAYIGFLNQYTAIGGAPVLYDECDCARSAVCVTTAKILSVVATEPPFPIRGIVTGCFIVEALPQSTFECFFDQLCFVELASRLSSTVTWNGTALDNQMKSRFSTTSTVGEMLEKLMVEDCNWKSEYSEYFNECRPVECKYTVQTRNDLIIIVTTVLGLIGGLGTSLRLIVPRVVGLVSFLHRRIRQRTNS